MTEIERLRAALKPFAEALERWETRPGHINTAHDDWILGDVDYLTIGDLKRAAKAYKGHPAPIAPSAGEEK